MNKIFFVFTLFIGFLGRSLSAEAAAVYLKNGRVMQGKIVEKTETYLVLKAGEGEDAVKVTVFADDINRIESEEDYARKTSLIPFGLGQANVSASAAPAEGGDGLELLKQSAQGRETIVSSGPATPDGGVFKWPKPPSGSISGTVILPDKLESVRGDLYVFLLKDIGGGQFVLPRPAHYRRIASADIYSREVPFRIEDVPVGVYKVTGYWDVSLPRVEEVAYSQGFALSKLGLKGDYFGRSPDPLAVSNDGEITGILVDCCSRLKADSRPSRLPEQGPDFDIEDLLYRRVSADDHRFTLILRNIGDRPTLPCTLSVLINGEEVLPPLSAGVVRAGQDRELDLTSAYNDYAENFRSKNRGAQPSDDLTFKIVWPPSGEVIFEKRVVIFR